MGLSAFVQIQVKDACLGNFLMEKSAFISKAHARGVPDGMEQPAFPTLLIALMDFTKMETSVEQSLKDVFHLLSGVTIGASQLVEAAHTALLEGQIIANHILHVKEGKFGINP